MLENDRYSVNLYSKRYTESSDACDRVNWLCFGIRVASSGDVSGIVIVVASLRRGGGQGR